MSMKKISAASLLAAGAAVSTIAFGPPAWADDCNDSIDEVVCESPGNDQEVATPPAISGGEMDGDQNGPYGPAGDTPPVGGGRH